MCMTGGEIAPKRGSSLERLRVKVGCPELGGGVAAVWIVHLTVPKNRPEDADLGKEEDDFCSLFWKIKSPQAR